MDGVTKLTSQHAVVIFSKSSCGAMRDTMATLFRDLGVSSLAVVELDEDPKGKEMEEALARMMPSRRNPAAGPAVFVAGRPVGSTEEVMSLHLGGKLVPLLRDARAILPC
jgi:glutaredoxin 3